MNRVKSWLKDQWQVLFPALPIQSIEGESLLGQTIILLEELDPVQFTTYRNVHGHGIGVSALYPHLDTYITGMQKHVTAMQRTSKAVNEQDCVRNIHQVNLNYFFTSNDGYYQNIKEDLLSFRAVALALCALLEEGKNAATPAGTYNVRALSPLIENIQLTTLTLLEVQQQLSVTV